MSPFWISIIYHVSGWLLFCSDIKFTDHLIGLSFSSRLKLAPHFHPFNYISLGFQNENDALEWLCLRFRDGVALNCCSSLLVESVCMILKLLKKSSVYLCCFLPNNNVACVGRFSYQASLLYKEQWSFWWWWVGYMSWNGQFHMSRLWAFRSTLLNLFWKLLAESEAGVSCPVLKGRLNFKKFETSKINDCLEFIKSMKLHLGGMCSSGTVLIYLFIMQF